VHLLFVDLLQLFNSKQLCINYVTVSRARDLLLTKTSNKNREECTNLTGL
ncbi:MAG: hypothetical protein ACI8RD_001145, partial [Bacillariaceae sp.]|jgi:hypothetical protein